ncbi:MAG TPA: alpha/beta fold hydrolase [Anaerolineae bacterium]|nr:alpha/beta fold hydrolase [Anaerolineae bacterium]
MKHLILVSLLVILSLAIASCAGQASPTPAAIGPTATATPSPLPGATPSATATATHTATATATATSSPTATATATPTETVTATPSPTPDPYAAFTVEGLAARSYGDGELRIEQVLAVTNAFTRTLVTFPSDGLTIYGFMNVPQGEGPFPVVLVLHGYVDPARYKTLTYTTGYADALARAGYLVIHPNFRNWPPSDSGPEDYRVGQAVDVLHLIGLVQKMGGQPGPLEQSDPERIGLWGHSMGGGISQRVITVSDDVDAAVLYGAMSGDEALNHQRILYFTNGANGLWDVAPPDEALQRISPINYLERVTAAVSIHHGDLDDQVPLAWSEDLCSRLQALEKEVECFTYQGQPHTFVGEGDQLFVQRVREFFDRTLRGQ